LWWIDFFQEACRRLAPTNISGTSLAGPKSLKNGAFARPGGDIPFNLAKENFLMTIRFGVLGIWPGISWTPLTVAPAGEGGASAASYGEDDLNSFAVAAVKVHRINNTYSQKMEEAGSDQEKEMLERKANGEMVNAVKHEGLTVDTYQDIVSRLQRDADLAARVRQKIKKVA
jgi:hypothetical protein